MVAILMIAGAGVAMTPDLTSDALTALTFIDDLKRGATDKAQSLLAPGAFLGDPAQTTRKRLSDFISYIHDCQLYRVTVIPQNHALRHLPVGVEWSCPYPDMNRKAGFWLDGPQINRIGWGGQPPASIPPVVERPSHR